MTQLVSSLTLSLPCGPSIPTLEKEHLAQENGPREFKLSDFTVDVEQWQATCPGGLEAERWTVSRRSDGSLAFIAYFGGQCATCSLRPQCTTAAQGRTIPSTSITIWS
jgi:hypothetical protein